LEKVSKNEVWHKSILLSEYRTDKRFFPYDPESQCGMIHNDHLGTPQKMTDSTGTVVWAADYKPFGEATITVSTITNNLGFPGQYRDAETGLNYNYIRDYNFVIGKYIEADPVGLRGGINLYVYTSDNPIRFFDRFGLLLGGNNATIGNPPGSVIGPQPKPPISCTGGCHSGYPPSGSFPQGCWDCDWQKIGECIGLAYDPDQIDACKGVCDSVKNLPPGPARVAAAAACAACVAGKSYEIADCFKKNCKWKQCCNK
jgi:RHS repeat-associated protein